MMRILSRKRLALELAVAQIERQFGKGAIMKLGEQQHLAVDAIPMTSESWADTWDGRLQLDALLDRHVRNA